MKQMTMIQALQQAMDGLLQSDGGVVILGEDVGKNGGVFRATDHLQEKYGEQRVIDTPLAESGIIATATGLALNGMKPLAEIQFLGFIYPAYDQMMTHVSRIRSRTLSKYTVPLVIRAPYGGGVRAPEIHSDSTEALFTHMPGLKVVVPSTPYDAKGLLIAAMQDPDPVLFLEPIRSYRSTRGEVPEEMYEVPLGEPALRREGDDVTLIGWGAMMPILLEAAERLAEETIQCEVIDVRTLYPFEPKLIIQSVKKTSRAVVVHEAQLTSGFGAEISSQIQEEAFLYLRSPVARVASYDVPYPFFAMEQDYLPSVDKVMQAVRETMTY